EERGRVVVVGGSREIAGAAQLAGIAALRAGAGKLVIATARPVAAALAQAVPEARVIPLDEKEAGSFEAGGVDALARTLDGAAAVLIGPGMMDPEGNLPFIARVLEHCREVPVVLDACAMDVVQRVGRFAQPVLLTPHAGEMAHLLEVEKDEVLADPEGIVLDAARRWNAVVALKGATTLIATPDGRGWRHDGRHPGLATSGSGDVLAGLVAGFAARQVPLEQACAWGVVMHAAAGHALARESAPLGFLARELPGPVPALVQRMSRGLRRWRAPRGG
ncbi:MAG TPA: NAD(P)H-hydrate dehydratase, partial [Burkholderiales bacterium]|nr:NAD(P)H-hydrate dehydratase [Burkholderiales bacterium]